MHNTDTVLSSETSIVESAAIEHAQGWADRSESTDRHDWRGHPPDSVVDYIEHTVLGRPMTEDEYGAVYYAFRSAYRDAMDAMWGEDN